MLSPANKDSKFPPQTTPQKLQSQYCQAKLASEGLANKENYFYTQEISNVYQHVAIGKRHCDVHTHKEGIESQKDSFVSRDPATAVSSSTSYRSAGPGRMHAGLHGQDRVPEPRPSCESYQKPTHIISDTVSVPDLFSVPDYGSRENSSGSHVRVSVCESMHVHMQAKSHMMLMECERSAKKREAARILSCAGYAQRASQTEHLYGQIDLVRLSTIQPRVNDQDRDLTQACDPVHVTLGGGIGCQDAGVRGCLGHANVFILSKDTQSDGIGTQIDGSLEVTSRGHDTHGTANMHHELMSKESRNMSAPGCPQHHDSAQSGRCITAKNTESSHRKYVETPTEIEIFAGEFAGMQNAVAKKLEQRFAVSPAEMVEWDRQCADIVGKKEFLECLGRMKWGGSEAEHVAYRGSKCDCDCACDVCARMDEDSIVVMVTDI